MDIIKATGEKEPFDKDKLCESIKQAGAPDALAENVCALVAQKATPEITTSQIFRKAVSYLVKEDIHVTAKYSLRRGIDDLGPAGFLFEHYVETIMQAYGYETERNVIMKGRCISHEVDVIARKGTQVCLIEAKYRNERGAKTHIDQVMYADARLIDIASKHTDKTFDQDHYHMWMVTNTKFTDKAIRYGQCRRMRIIGWNYPGKGNLADLIIEKKLYPITVLPSVSQFEREKFVERNMLLAQDVVPYSAEDLIKDFNIPPEIAGKIVEEARALLE
jgi:Holliday junction resolvase-like predicted endonuclease